MSEDLGSIYIEIELEVKRLLDGVDEVNRKLNELPEAANNAASSFDDTEQSADTLNTGLDKLAATIKAVIAASALKQMAEMVQKHQEYAERVRMATSSQAEFNEVQERLLKTANGTFRALSEAQELYITTAASLRSMGYTTNQAIDVQDSMSYAFVKNATSADKATSAISAFSKAINTGKVGADQWENITSAIPSVIDDIASASGKSSAQVRALGAAGKLTAKDLTEGLKQSLEANETAATGMSNTLVDATVRMNTAITSLLVSVEDGTGVLQAFTAGIISTADSILAFSQDAEGMKSTIDAGTKALGAMAIVFGARMVGSMAAAGKEKLRYIATTTNQLKAELATAEASKASAAQAQRHAVAEVRNAQLDRARLQNTINNNAAARQSAIMSAALADAQQRERAAKLALAQANTTLAASTTAVTTASRAASAGIRLASSALAMIGGPVGFAMIAGAGIYYLWQSMQQARQEALDFADGLDKLNDSMKSMRNVQLRGAIADANTAIEGQTAAAKALETEIEELIRKKQRATIVGGLFNSSNERAVEISSELSKKERDLADINEKVSKTTASRDSLQNTLNSNMLSSMGVHDSLIDKGSTLEQVQAGVAKAFGSTADEINRANQASQNFNPQSLQITPATADGDKMILSLEEQNELLKIKDERTRAVTKAEMEMAKVSQNGNQKTNAGRLAGENYDLQKAEEARKKAQQDANNESKKSAANSQSVAEKLANLKQQAEQAADSTLELSRAQTVQRAKDSLGKTATPADISLAADYAAKIWDRANAFKALSVAENLLPERQENTRYKQESTDLKNALDAQKITREEFNQASEKAERQHQANIAKIRSESVVSPQQEAAGLVDPVQQLANENARKLALIQQFEANKTITEQQGLELRNAANQQFEQQRIAAQWEIWRQQSMGNQVAAAAFDSFAGNASNALTGILTGSMSASDAMRSLGSTVLNSVINSFVQMGVEWAKSIIMGQVGMSAAAAASVGQSAIIASAAAVPAALMSLATSGANAVPAQAGIGATIGLAKTLAIAGARKNGGGVQPNQMYRVGEGGKPEILQQGNHNYLLSGDRTGKVISNKDMQGGGGGNVTVIIENYGTPQVVSQQREQSLTGQDVIRIIMQDANEKGPALQSIMANTNATPRLR